MNTLPEWLAELEDEEVNFIKNFVMNSGSLKDMAIFYGVSYPTVRLRLDRLIEKIHIQNQVSEDPYILMIKRMATNNKIEFEAAKILIMEFRKLQEGGK